MKVYIDAGHGGTDSGAIGINGRMEKTDNLNYAENIADEMKRRGHTVKLSRLTDSYPSLNQRADDANNWGADCFISCHRNAYSDSVANGSETLYGTNASKNSIRLAEEINSALARSGFKNRGAKRQSATVLQMTKMPAVTIEVGFITNVNDNKIFDEKRIVIVRNICEAIEKVFGTSGLPVPPIEPDETPYKYQIIGTADTFKYSGTSSNENVTLLSHYEGCNVANVKFADGKTGFVLWSALRKNNEYTK